MWTSFGDEAGSPSAVAEGFDALGFPWRFEAVDERVADTWRRLRQTTRGSPTISFVVPAGVTRHSR